MVDTLGDYQTEHDWGELTGEEQRNVLATYLVDLESRVEQLERENRILREDA